MIYRRSEDLEQVGMAQHRKVHVFLKRTFSQSISIKHLLCVSAEADTGKQVIKNNSVLEGLV